MDRVEFIPATEDHFNIILELERESFNIYDSLDRDSLVELYSEFSEGFTIIKFNGEIAGYSVYLVEEDAGYIESVAVFKRYRGKGLGLSVLRFMVERIRGRGLNRIYLHVRTDNAAAINLYEREGFINSGRIKGFYTDGGDAYRYSIEIH